MTKKLIILFFILNSSCSLEKINGTNSEGYTSITLSSEINIIKKNPKKATSYNGLINHLHLIKIDYAIFESDEIESINYNDENLVFNLEKAYLLLKEGKNIFPDDKGISFAFIKICQIMINAHDIKEYEYINNFLEIYFKNQSSIETQKYTKYSYIENLKKKFSDHMINKFKEYYINEYYKLAFDSLIQANKYSDISLPVTFKITDFINSYIKSSTDIHIKESEKTYLDLYNILDKDNKEFTSLKKSILEVLASFYGTIKEYEKAYSTIKKIVSLSNYSNDVYISYLNAFYKQNNMFDKSNEIYFAQLQTAKSEDLKDIYSNISNNYLKMKKYNESIGYLMKSINLIEDKIKKSEVYIEIAQIYLLLDDDTNMIKNYELSINEYKNINNEAYKKLRSYYLNKNDLENFIKYKNILKVTQ